MSKMMSSNCVQVFKVRLGLARKVLKSWQSSLGNIAVRAFYNFEDQDQGVDSVNRNSTGFAQSLHILLPLLKRVISTWLNNSYTVAPLRATAAGSPVWLHLSKGALPSRPALKGANH